MKNSFSTSKPKRHYPLWLRVSLPSVIAVGIIIATAFFLRADFWTVHTISIEGTKAVLAAEVRETADSLVNGSYLFIFPKRNSIIFPREQVREAILYSYPRIAEVILNPIGLKEFHILVSERVPHALWCTGVGQSKDDPCFVIDKTGFAFDHAPFFSDAVYVKYFDGSSPETNLLGRKFSPDLFITASNFSQWIQDHTALKPIRFTAETFNDITLTVEGGGKIIFNGKQDASVLGSTLDSVLKSSAFKVATGNNQSNFKTIDLRFGNKVYFVE